MTSSAPDHWQIQDAKQRFSEMIRAVTSGEPQVITRHGEGVAVVVAIGEYRRLTRRTVNLASVLLGGPKFEADAADVFDEIEAERKTDFGRSVEFGQARDIPARHKRSVGDAQTSADGECN